MLVLCLLTPSLLAHPEGTTEVTFTMHRDRTFAIAISIDAGALRAKLAALQRPLEQLIVVRFDGVQVALRPSPESPSSEGDVSVVRLIGKAPSGASHATFQTSLVYGSYVLTIRRPDGEPDVQWLQGLDASAPFATTTRAAATRGRPAVLVGLALALLVSFRGWRPLAASGGWRRPAHPDPASGR